MQYEDIKEDLRVTYAKEPTITDYYVSKDARGQSGKLQERQCPLVQDIKERL